MDDYTDCVGVDGARSGWIAVWWRAGALAYQVHADAAALVAAHRAARVVAVDIPIGLSDHGRRAADVRRRRSSAASAAAAFSPRRCAASWMRPRRPRPRAGTG